MNSAPLPSKAPTANDRLRYGRVDSIPHCIRKLPENQPRNRREAMIKNMLNPEIVDTYFDKAKRFLYGSKTMGQELEDWKKSRRQRLDRLEEQTGFLKSLIVKEKPKKKMDIAAMRERYNKAQREHAKLVSSKK